jgi:pimeloyl-ACP methyl ester carboxylesterase
MDRTIFIIPGFKQKITDVEYTWLKKFLKSKGFDVVMVPVEWNHRTISDNVAEFKDFYEINKSKSNYVLGFSYGALIALIVADSIDLKRLYLCSLSPDFKEDLPDMKPWILNYIGKKRVNDLKKRSGKEIAAKLTVPTVVFYGEKEIKDFPNMEKRSQETVRFAKNAKLIIVKDAPHVISYPTYVAAIKKEFNNF